MDEAADTVNLTLEKDEYLVLNMTKAEWAGESFQETAVPVEDLPDTKGNYLMTGMRADGSEDFALDVGSSHDMRSRGFSQLWAVGPG